MLMDNIIVRALTRLFDLILLNILWTLCSLPVVTAGAATTALYTVMLKLVVNEEGYIVRDFLRSFKENFRQSTVVWLILLAAGVLIGADAAVLLKEGGAVSGIALAGLGAAALLYALELLFVFPLIAKFENSTAGMLKNGILIPVSRLPFALPVLVMTALCIVLTFLNRKTIMVGAVVWSIAGVSVLAYANSVFIRKVFEPYL